MAPQIALIVTYLFARLVLRGRPDRTLPSRVALAVMLLLTASAHFFSTDELAAMVPPLLPAPHAIVYATGVVELAFAVLLVVRPSPALGWLVAGFFFGFTPRMVPRASAELTLARPAL